MPAAETMVVTKWCMGRKVVGSNLAVGIWLFCFPSLEIRYFGGNLPIYFKNKFSITNAVDTA